jgi:hypothetical protein
MWGVFADVTEKNCRMPRIREVGEKKYFQMRQEKRQDEKGNSNRTGNEASRAIVTGEP